MDADQINRLADEIAARIDFFGPSYWVALFLIAACSCLAAFFGAYLKKRGENWATREEFEKLLDQVEKTTKSTETIKTKIASSDWHEREWVRIRREKIEALMEALLTCDRWLDDARAYYVYGKGSDPGFQPNHSMKILQRLYFPELRGAVASYILMFLNTSNFYRDIYQRRLLLAAEDIPALYDEHDERITETVTLESNAREALADAIEAFVRQIYVDRAPTQSTA